MITFYDYNELDTLPEGLRERIEKHLSCRMIEETEGKWDRKIDLTKTDGIVEVFIEDGVTYYHYQSDCDEYVFGADILFGSDGSVEERDFGTSLTEWLGCND